MTRVSDMAISVLLMTTSKSPASDFKPCFEPSFMFSVATVIIVTRKVHRTARQTILTRDPELGNQITV
jgi:hypothetical protein